MGGNKTQVRSAKTEFWNGSSFGLKQMIYQQIKVDSGGSGTADNAINLQVDLPAAKATTEEWTASLANKTITTS